MTLTAARFQVMLMLACIGFSAQHATAQQPAENQSSLILDELMTKTHDEIVRMDAIELRSLIGVLVECSILKKGEPAKSVCHSAYEKYAIEYNQDRAVDQVLVWLSLAKASLSGDAAAISFNFKPSISRDDMTRAIENANKTMASMKEPASVLNQELTLKKWVNESFKKKRGQ